MAVLSTNPESRLHWRDVGRAIATGLAWVLFTVGWLLGKTVRAIGQALAAGLYAVGWFAAAVVWPSLCWCGRAVRLGWQEGRKPIGGRRGDS